MSEQASASEPVEVLRWYTSALRIPRLIGKLTSGERIWGGPYTVTQAVVGGVVLILGVKTMPWWGPIHLFGEGLIGFVANWAVVAGSAFALVKISGNIPTSRVNVGLALRGGWRQLIRRTHVRWRGSRPQVGRKSTRAGRVVITDMAVSGGVTARSSSHVPAAASTPQPSVQPIAPIGRPMPSASPAEISSSRPGPESTAAVVDKLAALVGR